MFETCFGAGIPLGELTHRRAIRSYCSLVRSFRERKEKKLTLDFDARHQSGTRQGQTELNSRLSHQARGQWQCMLSKDRGQVGVFERATCT
jgi:hypothetical protein